MPDPAATLEQTAAVVPPVKPVIDPFMAQLAKTMNMSLDGEEFTMKPLSKAELGSDEPGLGARSTMGELAASTSKPAAPPAPVPAAVAPPAPAAEIPAAPVVPAAPALPVRKSSSEEILEIQRKISTQLDALSKAPPAPVAPAAPASTPKPIADEEYLTSLPEENRETIELLKWASEKHPEFKGKDQEQIQYLKRMDEFLRTNPEDDAVEEFRAKNKPQLSEAAVRRLSRERLKEEVKREAIEESRQEMSTELAELRKKQRELEIKPLLEQASKEFRTRFTAESTKLPDGVDRIKPEVANDILSMPIDQAMEKHRIEAPILHYHAKLADDFLAMSHGQKEFDAANPDHQFLNKFIFHQENVLLRTPAAQTRNGKQFLPTVQFMQMHQKDATGTESKYWMFSNDEIREMLEINAHKQVQVERKKIIESAKSMGYSLTPAPAAAPAATVSTPAAPVVIPASASPKGGSSLAPGAAAPARAQTALDKHLGALYPEASALAGI